MIYELLHENSTIISLLLTPLAICVCTARFVSDLVLPPKTGYLASWLISITGCFQIKMPTVQTNLAFVMVKCIQITIFILIRAQCT